MKNPLNKRIPKELMGDFGKYFVIFAFMVLLIGAVSGFLVSANSLQISYEEGIEKYKLEDGHFSFNAELPEEVRTALEEQENLTIYDLSFFEEDLDNTQKTIRVYTDRSEVNTECLMEGRMPKADDEIALDRLFCRNNAIAMGDTISLAGKTLKVVGTVAVPDYNCLFESNADTMFDTTNFSIGIMTGSGYEAFGSVHETKNYAWRYAEKIERTDVKAASARSDKLIDTLEEVIKAYDERFADEAIASGKLLALCDTLDELEEQGIPLSMFDSKEGRESLLEELNKVMEEQDIDLTEEFSEVLKEYPGKEVVLTVEDLELAMHAFAEDRDEAQDALDTLEDRIFTVKGYLPRYANNGINFAINDLGGDSAMIILFSYIVIIILAFLFAVTTSSTIVKEAGVIGTLRASGYSRGELLRHYMLLPILVSLLAAVIGNVLGYTVFKKFAADLEYNSYSLATFEVQWNARAFVLTTVVPMVLMIFINFLVLYSKLCYSPLRFLRRDLSKRGKKKAFRLNTKLPIMFRFRLRVIFQNIPNYLTLAVGILVGGMLVVFGNMFTPLLEDYADLVTETRIADYQYVVMSTEVVTENEEAEKYALTSLDTTDEKFVKDEISIYGIVENSSYVKTEFPAGKAVASNTMMAKFGLKEGDVVTLKSATSGKTYDFTIGGEYVYDGALALFLPIEEYRDIFAESGDYFTGYFSNSVLSDVEAEDIATIITVEDLQKLSTQLKISMGEMMGMMSAVGVAMFVLLMFILSKQIIEKNANSIAMTKILGFRDKEIGGLYVIATSLVVVLSLLISIPLIERLLYWAFTDYLYREMSGYIPYVVDSGCYVKMFVLGLGTYAVISIFQFIKISRIPKTDALKNVE